MLQRCRTAATVPRSPSSSMPLRPGGLMSTSAAAAKPGFFGLLALKILVRGEREQSGALLRVSAREALSQARGKVYGLGLCIAPVGSQGLPVCGRRSWLQPVSGRNRPIRNPPTLDVSCVPAAPCGRSHGSALAQEPWPGQRLVRHQLFGEKKKLLWFLVVR